MGRVLAGIIAFAALALPGLAAAQAAMPFGDFAHDASLPVEIAADSLDLNREGGSATFEGSVDVAQGSLRMQADRIEVTYAEDGEVSRMEAIGNVLLTNGDAAAESQRALYDVAAGEIDMEGDVLLVQGENALSGQKLVIDLDAGTARMEGRVKTVLTPPARN